MYTYTHQFDVDIVNTIDDLDKKVFAEFLKPYYDNRILLNIEELRNGATVVPFKASYNFRPDLVAYDHLNIISGAWLILAINKVSSLMNFTIERIGNELLVPLRSDVEKLFD